MQTVIRHQRLFAGPSVSRRTVHKKAQLDRWSSFGLAAQSCAVRDSFRMASSSHLQLYMNSLVSCVVNENVGKEECLGLLIVWGSCEGR